MVRLKFHPIEPVSLNFFYYQFRLQDPAAFTRINNLATPVTSTNYADEYDVIIDWNVNSHLFLALVGAYAIPHDAAIQQTGGKENWSLGMLMGSIKF